MNTKTKNILLGVGIGVAVGGTAGTLIGISAGKKSARKQFESDIREHRKAAYQRGYSRGTEDTMIETQKWMDENLLVIEADNPEAAQEAIQSHFTADKPQSDASDDQEPDQQPKRAKTASEGLKMAYSEESDIAIEPAPEPQKPQNHSDPEVTGIFTAPKQAAAEQNSNQKTPDPQVHSENPGDASGNGMNDVRYTLTSDNTVGIEYNGKLIEYPKGLFFDENGYSFGISRIRANLLEYEKNPQTLKKVWIALGWGNYFPEDPVDETISEEDLRNMDLSIDEQLGDEPEEKTIERQRYLDMVEKYKENPVNCPNIVPQRRFEEDCYLDHIYVDYYDVDNIFVDSTNIEKELDAYMMFGVTDGKDLFKYKAEHPFDPEDDNNDPEIVHVENFHNNVIAEITRYHKSYAGIKDGSAYLDGGST